MITRDIKNMLGAGHANLYVQYCMWVTLKCIFICMLYVFFYFYVCKYSLVVKSILLKYYNYNF